MFVDGAPREFSYSLAAFPVAPPAPPRFGGDRTRDTATVTWDAADERGAPVTGYRVVGEDGGAASQFDRTAGPEARSITVP